jgi:tRNA pseudouridine32 synthase/23S rRNA pseudouridine746 synthase
VEDCFAALRRHPAQEGPWLAHRLDADTAGCLVVALRRSALRAAQAAFAAGSVRKIYWAVVHGRPREAGGTLALSLSRESTPGGWRMRADPGGQSASSTWRLLGTAGGLSWLEVQPHTGRTHQVRVHCAALGCPLLGDRVYGSTAAAPMHLLARSIVLPLDPPVSATAPPPDFMAASLAACGWRPER